MEKKAITDEQAMKMMLDWGIPIIKSVHAALKMNNPARSLGMVINTLIDKDADHTIVVSGCIGAIVGLMLANADKQEDANESA